jgi:hypothetical protein
MQFVRSIIFVLGLTAALPACCYEPVPVLSAEDIVAELQRVCTGSIGLCKRTGPETPVVAKDESKRIWQIQAITQEGFQCGWHTPRNLIYLGLICSSPKGKIEGLYVDMRGEYHYKNFLKKASGKEYIQPSDFVNDLRVNKEFFQRYGKLFPLQSEDLVPVMSTFTYHNEKGSGAGQGEKRYTDLALKLIIEVEEGKVFQKGKEIQVFKEIQGVKRQEKVVRGSEEKKYEQKAQDVGCMLANRIPFFEQIYTTFILNHGKVALSEPALRCVRFGVWAGAGHWTALVVHRFQKKYSYFFVDSLNDDPVENIDLTNPDYRAALNRFKRFIEKPQDFLDAFLRFEVVYFDEQITAKPLNIGVYQQALGKITKNGLNKLALWKNTYKKYVLKRLKDTQADWSRPEGEKVNIEKLKKIKENAPKIKKNMPILEELIKQVAKS